MKYQSKLEMAVALMQRMFAKKKPVPIADAIKAGEKAGIGRRTLTRACRIIGVRTIINGTGAAWEKK